MLSLVGLAEALEKQKLRMHLYGSVDRNSVNVTSQAASIAASKPDAVVIVAGGHTALISVDFWGGPGDRRVGWFYLPTIGGEIYAFAQN